FLKFGLVSRDSFCDQRAFFIIIHRGGAVDERQDNGFFRVKLRLFEEQP
ncbi:MAG: hypothetical protein RJB25_1075, partial [Bacteroidota bacterium]